MTTPNFGKVAVVAPAIKIKFWKDIYMGLSRGNVPFHLVFVGHVRPIFKLPPNFTYIYSDLPAAPCVEIAYRYVYKHIPDAKYVVNIADDLHLAPTLLEELIKFYNKQKQNHSVDLLAVGPTCLMRSGEENLMATHDGGPALLAPNFTTIENSKKIGGVDKRFIGIYWDCDRALRVHQLGGKIIFAGCDEVSPVSEIEHTPGLFVRYKNSDRPLLDSLWTYTESEDENNSLVSCASLTRADTEYEQKFRRCRNELVFKNIMVQRKDDVQEFGDELNEYIREKQ